MILSLVWLSENNCKFPALWLVEKKNYFFSSFFSFSQLKHICLLRLSIFCPFITKLTDLTHPSANILKFWNSWFILLQLLDPLKNSFPMKLNLNFKHNFHAFSSSRKFEGFSGVSYFESLNWFKLEIMEVNYTNVYNLYKWLCRQFSN